MKKDYDMVVIGAGIAGVCAALAAARRGLKVALVEKQEFLGGNASADLMVKPEGAMAMGHNRFADESGLAGEIRSEWYRHRIWNCRVLSQILWQLVTSEKNVDVYLHHVATQPVMGDEFNISAVDVQHLISKEEVRLAAPLFADCSGDGHVAFRAGAEYRMGREARAEFGESLAPEKPDGGIMGATLMYGLRDMPFDVPFASPKEARRFDEYPFLDREHHNDMPGSPWWLEYATVENVFDDQALMTALYRIWFGYFDHLKKEHPDFYARRFVEHLPKYPARRESRRFVGDCLLTQNDIEQGTDFSDKVCHGGWPIDIHAAGGITSKDRPAIQKFVNPYSIPYRCLHSKNIANLFFAGRDVSVTHCALGSTRVEWTCGVMGEVVGTAAALCRRYGCRPRDIHPAHISELQQELLKNDCYIPGLRNCDPEDKALRANVLATSQMPLRITDANRVDRVMMGEKAAQTIPLSGSVLDQLILMMANSSAKSTRVTVRLFVCGDSLNTLFHMERILAEAWVDLDAGFKGWASFPLHAEGLDPRRVHGWFLTATHPVEIGVSEREVPGCLRGRGSNQDETIGKYTGYAEPAQALWHEDIGTYCFRTDPIQYPFSPQNVVNGIARPEIHPNVWISDPALEFPHDLELGWEKAERVREIRLTFNTGLNCTYPVRFVGRECVKAYEIYARHEGIWEKVADERENLFRRRIHRMDCQTDRLRIRILATHGEPQAEVAEVRIY
ncbi:MAG: FAD-dependent oxidoreductase [Verrucomicrobiae bacterium]|nr:FAD-dependent oxidoreductase [Verrucomicrobiae bacterium]